MTYDIIEDAELERQVSDLRNALGQPVDPVLLMEIVKIRKAVDEIRTVLQRDTDTVTLQGIALEQLGRVYGETLHELKLLAELNESLLGKLAAEKVLKTLVEIYQAILVGQTIVEARA